MAIYYHKVVTLKKSEYKKLCVLDSIRFRILIRQAYKTIFMWRNNIIVVLVRVCEECCQRETSDVWCCPIFYSNSNGWIRWCFL